MSEQPTAEQIADALAVLRDAGWRLEPPTREVVLTTPQIRQIGATHLADVAARADTYARAG